MVIFPCIWIQCDVAGDGEFSSSSTCRNGRTHVLFAGKPSPKSVTGTVTNAAICAPWKRKPLAIGNRRKETVKHPTSARQVKHRRNSRPEEMEISELILELCGILKAMRCAKWGNDAGFEVIWCRNSPGHLSFIFERWIWNGIIRYAPTKVQLHL